jgi:hypothetical protein
LEFVKMYMNSKCFLFLLKCLRFNLISTKEERRKSDKMTNIGPIFEHFVLNCQQNYSPGEYLTTYEILIPCRGHCAFKQYIPKKLAKYGLKIFSMVDCRTFYTPNIKLCQNRARWPIQTEQQSS